MKKLLFGSLCLLLWSVSPAQSPFYSDVEQGYKEEKKIKIKIHSNDGSVIIIELDRLSQLDSFANMTTLLPRVLERITPAVSGLQNPQTTKLVQYNRLTPVYVKEYLPEYKDYQVKDGSLQEMKSRPDTLRITTIEYGKLTRQGMRVHHPIYLSIMLPHLSDLGKVNAPAIDSAIQKIKSQTNRNSFMEKNVVISYDAQKRDWIFPSGAKAKATYIEPDLHVGVQYVRGHWVPSAAVGMQLIKGNYTGNRSVYQLMWEPHFLFGTNSSGAVRAQRNDFITFRFHSHYLTGSKRKKEQVMRFSVGYLFYRTGDLYQEHTIKFSLPGVNFKTLYLEPEFFFHEFFRHFSPSLKLSLNMD